MYTIDSFSLTSMFLDIGYERSEIIGRNCRFLQGPDTDPSHVATIREGIASGKDTAVVLTNYKKDGTPFSECALLLPHPWRFGLIVCVCYRCAATSERVLHGCTTELAGRSLQLRRRAVCGLRRDGRRIPRKASSQGGKGTGKLNLP